MHLCMSSWRVRGYGASLIFPHRFQKSRHVLPRNMTEWSGKAGMLLFQITVDLCKASGTKVALFQTNFRYSVPIYVWIYENGVKELDPKPWFLRTIRPSLGPVNGQKVEKGGLWIKGRQTGRGRKKALTLLLIFISSTLETLFLARKKDARLGREFNFSTPFSKIQTFHIKRWTDHYNHCSSQSWALSKFILFMNRIDQVQGVYIYFVFLSRVYFIEHSAQLIKEH